MNPDRSSTTAALRPFRDEIDRIDDQLIECLARRYAVVREVAEVKHRLGIAPFLPDRVKAVLDRVGEKAAQTGLEAEIARAIWTTIIDRACALEQRLIDHAG